MSLENRRSGARFRGRGSGSATRKDAGRKIREEGEGCTPSDRLFPVPVDRAGAAVPSVRQVVLGHVFAILAPLRMIGSVCEIGKPAFALVDGVIPKTLDPGAMAPGSSSRGRCYGFC